MSLLKFLQTNEESRKVFGQRELKIIEKQLKGVNLTQSEKNRLSRDIRKKFSFIAKVSRFEEEFNLKKGAIVKRTVEDVKQTILENAEGVQEIMLYGSAVHNRLTLRSDIDIAVKFNNISIKDSTLFRKKISGKVPDNVDVQVYNMLPDKIKRQINERKKLIYVR